ncbi:MAG: tRNA (adenosine(37)-N6)-threonylcarbamoyltransferase complex dimerization subunit type 1 TsaB [Vallitaleaceae bacterium]|nr:tRNA (adenosine(37)-N6)-threonylcarbamoyltransferase complex dimerization subunit type 1 TsaB [Vallitaleaceae bacterium]
MKVLALDTSGLVASVALANEQGILAEFTTNYKKTHSVTLMPMIEEMVKRVDLDLKTLDLIAVSAGPGSFTGLRIGSSTAKGLAHVLNLPIASISTLEGLASNISKTNCLICPMLDARRQQVYTAIYRYEGNIIIPITEEMACTATELMGLLGKYDEEVIFLGDGVAPNIKEIEQHLAPSKWSLASSGSTLQRASSIALLGLRAAAEGKLQTYMEHAPNYLRKSQAEREREEKNQ